MNTYSVVLKNLVSQLKPLLEFIDSDLPIENLLVPKPILIPHREKKSKFPGLL